MRHLSQYAQKSDAIKSLLDSLVDRGTPSQAYRNAFYQLGGALSDFIRHSKRLTNQTTITLACSSEDADWLSKGILDHLEQYVGKINLAVFWNVRTNIFDNSEFAIAPIIKQYDYSTQRSTKFPWERSTEIPRKG